MSDNLLFADLETFGLVAERDPIVEIALVVTNSDLKVIDSFTSTIWGKKQTDRYVKMRKAIEKMLPSAASEAFVMKMHTDTGLFDKAMRELNPMHEVEEEAINFAREYGFGKTDPICGSSVSFDRGFMAEQMASFNDVFSYRIIDVSSFKELFRKKFPKRFAQVTEELLKMNAEDGLVQHTALDDCLASINELKMYSANFFTGGALLAEGGAVPQAAGVMTGQDRPDGCCGKCPPILGGGYDCTCSGNPRCTGTMTALPSLADARRLADEATDGMWKPSERIAFVAASRTLVPAMEKALRAVLAVHTRIPYGDDRTRSVAPGVPEFVCEHCMAEYDGCVPYPCPTVRAIAEYVSIEED